MKPDKEDTKALWGLLVIGLLVAVVAILEVIGRVKS